MFMNKLSRNIEAKDTFQIKIITTNTLNRQALIQKETISEPIISKLSCQICPKLHCKSIVTDKQQ